MKTSIIEVNTDEELKSSASCIQDAFQSVAEKFNLTRDNAPNNGAFLDFGKLKSEWCRGMVILAIKEHQSGELVGTIGLKKVSSDRYEISRVAVRRNYQGRGVGAGLLKAAQKYIKDETGKTGEVIEIVLGCIAEDQTLIAFYENNGYEVQSVKTFKRLPHKVCFMKKRVSL